MVKVSTLFYAVVLSAAATDAWSVSYHTRNNIRWDTHGTRDVSCNKLNWSTGNAQEDVQYIKFDAATTGWPDPTTLTVYPGSRCGSGGVKFKPGIHKPAKGFLVGSYSIN